MANRYKKGFDECMRVLDKSGVLIFKWNEEQIKLKQILDLIDYRPLIGNKEKKSKDTLVSVYERLTIM